MIQEGCTGTLTFGEVLEEGEPGEFLIGLRVGVRQLCELRLAITTSWERYAGWAANDRSATVRRRL
jgi:hypothetical protein